MHEALVRVLSHDYQEESLGIEHVVISNPVCDSLKIIRVSAPPSTLRLCGWSTLKTSWDLLGLSVDPEGSRSFCSPPISLVHLPSRGQ
jgi:hypothetical protein